MKTIAIGVLAMGLCGGVPAAAQTTVYWPAPASAAQSATMSYFPMGTALKLITRTQVSTKDNKPGDRFYLEVAESLSYHGQVVVPAGSVAVGEVADLQRNGHFGKKGKLGIQLLYVETPSGPVRLSGRANNEGTSGTIPSIATIALVSWTGMFIHGTSAHLASGTAVDGYLAEDMRFAVHPILSQVALNQATPDDARIRAMPASYLEASRAQGVQTAGR